MVDGPPGRPIGIVVNPRSGTDVRRAVAAAGTVTVEDKANVVRRVVRGAREAGASRCVVHHDPHRIVPGFGFLHTILAKMQLPGGFLSRLFC